METLPVCPAGSAMLWYATPAPRNGVSTAMSVTWSYSRARSAVAWAAAFDSCVQTGVDQNGAVRSWSRYRM
jgi:hypothetical protein